MSLSPLLRDVGSLTNTLAISTRNFGHTVLFLSKGIWMLYARSTVEIEEGEMRGGLRNREK